MLTSSAFSQLCQNSADTVYGLTTTGQVVGINVNNAGSVAIGSPAASAANSNGMGFSQVNGLYYFFNQTGSGTTQFVSYNPLNSSLVTLSPAPAALPATLLTSQKIRSGAVNKTGTGYYTINPAATGGAALYYYNIAVPGWTTISQNFQDASAVSLNSSLSTLNSGDMAFDGSGNLWILASNATNYALYKIAAPVPTTATATITMTVYIPATTTTPLGASFTGIAFNSAGKLYITTGTAGAAAGQNKLYLLSTPSSASLTLVGSITSDYGADISSCAFPTNPLPVQWLDFKAQLKDKSVDLSWKVIEDRNTSGYDIQSATDGRNWNTIAHINKSGSANDNTEKVYNFSDDNFQPGPDYYRIVQYDMDGKMSYSVTREVIAGLESRTYIGPNPVKDVLFIYNRNNNSKRLVQVYDRDGRQVSSSVLNAGEQTISVGQLQRGVYMLRLSSALPGTTPEIFRFVKQ